MPWGPSSCFSAPPSPLCFSFSGQAPHPLRGLRFLLLKPSTHIPYGLRGRRESPVSSSLLSQASSPTRLRGRGEYPVSSSLLSLGARAGSLLELEPGIPLEFEQASSRLGTGAL